MAGDNMDAPLMKETDFITFPDEDLVFNKNRTNNTMSDNNNNGLFQDQNPIIVKTLYCKPSSSSSNATMRKKTDEWFGNMIQYSPIILNNNNNNNVEDKRFYMDRMITWRSKGNCLWLNENSNVMSNENLRNNTILYQLSSGFGGSGSGNAANNNQSQIFTQNGVKLFMNQQPRDNFMKHGSLTIGILTTCMSIQRIVIPLKEVNTNMMLNSKRKNHRNHEMAIDSIFSVLTNNEQPTAADGVHFTNNTNGHHNNGHHQQASISNNNNNIINNDKFVKTTNYLPLEIPDFYNTYGEPITCSWISDSIVIIGFQNGKIMKVEINDYDQSLNYIELAIPSYDYYTSKIGTVYNSYMNQSGNANSDPFHFTISPLKFFFKRDHQIKEEEESDFIVSLSTDWCISYWSIHDNIRKSQKFLNEKINTDKYTLDSCKSKIMTTPIIVNNNQYEKYCLVLGSLSKKEKNIRNSSRLDIVYSIMSLSGNGSSISETTTEVSLLDHPTRLGFKQKWSCIQDISTDDQGNIWIVWCYIDGNNNDQPITVAIKYRLNMNTMTLKIIKSDSIWIESQLTFSHNEDYALKILSENNNNKQSSYDFWTNYISNAGGLKDGLARIENFYMKRIFYPGRFSLELLARVLEFGLPETYAHQIQCHRLSIEILQTEILKILRLWVRDESCLSVKQLLANNHGEINEFCDILCQKWLLFLETCEGFAMKDLSPLAFIPTSKTLLGTPMILHPKGIKLVVRKLDSEKKTESKLGQCLECVSKYLYDTAKDFELTDKIDASVELNKFDLEDLEENIMSVAEQLTGRELECLQAMHTENELKSFLKDIGDHMKFIVDPDECMNISNNNNNNNKDSNIDFFISNSFHLATSVADCAMHTVKIRYKTSLALSILLGFLKKKCPHFEERNHMEENESLKNIYSVDLMLKNAIKSIRWWYAMENCFGNRQILKEAPICNVDNTSEGSPSSLFKGFHLEYREVLAGIHSTQQSQQNKQIDFIDLSELFLKLWWDTTISQSKSYSVSYLRKYSQYRYLFLLINLLPEEKLGISFVNELLGETYLSEARRLHGEGVTSDSKALFDHAEKYYKASVTCDVSLDLVNAITVISIVDRYIEIINIFDQSKDISSCSVTRTLNFAYAALDLLNMFQKQERIANSEEQETTLWSIIFSNCIVLNKYDEAFAAMSANPCKERRKDNLKNLTIVLCEKGHLGKLCSLPFSYDKESMWDMIADVETSLLLTAQCTNIFGNVPVVNYYHCLYAFHVFHGNYAKAAECIYKLHVLCEDNLSEWNHKTIESKQGKQKELEMAMKCLLIEYNCLNILPEDIRYIYEKQTSMHDMKKINENSNNMDEDQQSKISFGSVLSTKKRKRDILESSYVVTALDVFGQLHGTRSSNFAVENVVKVITVDIIYKKLCCMIAGNELCKNKKDNILYSSTLIPETLVDKLVSIGKFESAYALATTCNTESSLERLVMSLARCCVALQKWEDAKYVIQDRDTPRAIISSHYYDEEESYIYKCSQDAWILLQEILFTMDSVSNNFKFHGIAVKAMLEMDIKMKLPIWLVDSFMGLREGKKCDSNPGILLQIYIEWGLLIDACEYSTELIYHTKNNEDKNKGGINISNEGLEKGENYWLPYVLFDHLLNVCDEMEKKKFTSNDNYATKLKQKKTKFFDELQLYFDWVLKFNKLGN